MSNPSLTSKIFNSLKHATDDQERFEILERYKSDSLLKTIIQYMYNPLIDFGLERFIPQHMGKHHGMGISKFMKIPEEILENSLTTEESEYKCNLALMHMNDGEAEIFVNMVSKQDQYNLNIDLINDVWPGLVPRSLVLEPQIYNNKLATNIEYPAAVQKLSHGLRVIIIVRGNTVEFRNKEGQLLTQLDKFGHQFSILAQNGNVVFDGHAIKVDAEMNPIQASDEEILEAHEDNVRFFLWDVVKYDGYVKGFDNRMGYNWRFNGLEHMMFLSIEHNVTPCYGIAPQMVVGNIEQAIKFSKEQGGAVLKDLSSVWSSGPKEDHLILLPQLEA